MKGIEAGQTAVKLQEGKPEGHFWLARLYGGTAQTSALAGLSECERRPQRDGASDSVERRHQDGSAYMVLGLVDCNRLN